MFRILVDPFEDLAIAFSRFELLLEPFGIYAGELEESLVQGAIVVVFAILPIHRGTAFVEAAGQKGIAAEPHTRAARRPLSKIRCIIQSHSFIFFQSFKIPQRCRPTPARQGPHNIGHPSNFARRASEEFGKLTNKATERIFLRGQNHSIRRFSADLWPP